MKRIILSLTLIAILVACNNKKDRSVDHFKEFPVVKKVQFEEIMTPHVTPFIGDMLMLDSFLVVIDLMSETFFHIYRLPAIEYLGGYVTKGVGPADEVAIIPNLISGQNGSFLYRTLSDLKEATVSASGIVVQNKYSLPERFYNVMQLTKVGDVLVGFDNEMNTNNEYLQLNSENNRIVDFGGGYPELGFDIQPDKYSQLFTKSFATNPDGTKFASLYYSFPILRIYNMKSESMIEKRLNNNQGKPYVQESSEFVESLFNETTINYLKIKTTHSYIYGLYSGKTHGELKTQERRTADYGYEIHVWDWEGNPIAKYELCRPVFSFSVDLNDSYIVCSSVLDDNKLFRFMLN